MEAKEQGLAGTFIYKTYIDENGNYLRHINPPNIPTVFYKEIEKHISKVKFSPGIQNGKPIKCWVNVPFHFILH